VILEFTADGRWSTADRDEPLFGTYTTLANGRVQMEVRVRVPALAIDTTYTGTAAVTADALDVTSSGRRDGTPHPLTGYGAKRVGSVWKSCGQRSLRWNTFGRSLMKMYGSRGCAIA